MMKFMFKTMKRFFDFCGKEDRNKLYLAIALGVVKAIFAALRITAIGVAVQGIIDGQMTSKHLLLALGIMLVSVIGQFCVSLKTTMLQCEAGYHACAHKRIEIAENLRYLPMGFFNKNSLGAITNVTTNTMESLADIATRIVMITTQGILTTAVIACFVLAFDWRIGLVLVGGIALYILFNAVMQRSTRPAAPRKNRADEELVTQVIEYVQGIAEVKNYSMTDDAARKLDEATANVDPENETELTEAIEALTKEKTIIMIAHRLKTVRHADQIFVVENGRIVQHGTHHELITKNGIYKSFVEGRQEAASWKIA